MAKFQAGDLVVLKSGGPTMTVDTVNTDIFDDDTITGVLCVWFVGDRLERVRFDHRAIELARAQATRPSQDVPDPPLARADMLVAQESSGDYKAVLDTMADAMNGSADVVAAPRKPAKRTRAATRPAVRRNTH